MEKIVPFSEGLGPCRSPIRLRSPFSANCPSRLQLFRLRLLPQKGKIVIRIIKRSIHHIKMPSSRHPQKAWKYTLITVCLPKSLIRFTMKYQSATPIKVLCNTSGFCFWAYPAWSSPAYWRQVVAAHNAQRHRIQSSFPRMLQSPAVF